jgi:hypothetical protein
LQADLSEQSWRGMLEMPLLSLYCVLILVEPCVRVLVCRPKHGTACCNVNVLDLYSRNPRFVSQARCWLLWGVFFVPFSKSLQVILICLWWLHVKPKHVALNYPVYKKSCEWRVLSRQPTVALCEFWVTNMEFVLLFQDMTRKFILVIVSRTVTLQTNQLSAFLALFSKLP